RAGVPGRGDPPQRGEPSRARRPRVAAAAGRPGRRRRRGGRADGRHGGVGRGRAAVRAVAARPAGEPVGDWRVSYDLGRYGTDYLRRAAAARVGLGAEPATDELPAVLDADADGRPLT